MLRTPSGLWCWNVVHKLATVLRLFSLDAPKEMNIHFSFILCYPPYRCEFLAHSLKVCGRSIWSFFIHILLLSSLASTHFTQGSNQSRIISLAGCVLLVSMLSGSWPYISSLSPPSGCICSFCYLVWFGLCPLCRLCENYLCPFPSAILIVLFLFHVLFC